jgi:ATP-binding cassette subfamily F protein uup
LLTILFRNPNFLILDEPTNDLDLPTLAVLENFLSEFQGCLLIVSHDRYFMDRLVDHLFVFEGNGYIRDFPGNYTIYRIWQKEQEQKTLSVPVQTSSTPPAQQETNPSVSKKKLSFNEKREFEQLEKEIPKLEQQKAALNAKLASGQLEFQELQEISLKIGTISQELEEKEMRWLELSEMAGA